MKIINVLMLAVCGLVFSISASAQDNNAKENKTCSAVLYNNALKTSLILTLVNQDDSSSLHQTMPVAAGGSSGSIAGLECGIKYRAYVSPGLNKKMLGAASGGGPSGCEYTGGEFTLSGSVQFEYEKDHNKGNFAFTGYNDCPYD